MSQPVIIDASKARQEFFKLLEIVEKEDKEVLIKRRGEAKVKITKVGDQKPSQKEIKQKLEALTKLSQLGAGTTMEWRKMKKIISTLHFPTFE